MKPYTGPPMTLGSAAAAHVRFMVWCTACEPQVELDPAPLAPLAPDGAVPDRRAPG